MAAAAGGVLPLPFVSETARERETLTFDDLGITKAALRRPSPVVDKLIPTSILSSTPDPALTAFAQLGLYRLNATHSIVSLFDRTYQHFVAEAVRCAPLCPEDLPDPEGQRVFCGTAIPRTNSICEHVLTGPAEDASIPGGGQGAANLLVTVIPNLDQDSRFCYLRDKNSRFYAGVPIRSPSGINIGVYCVLDNKPRPAGLTGDQIQFVRDISQTVMDYLHAKRSNEWYRREERMVRGLGSFVEGQATLSNWSESLDNSSFRDIPGVQEGALNKKLQGIPHIHEQDRTESEEPETQPSLSGFCPTPTTSFDSQARSRTNGSVSSVSSSDMLLGDVERVFSKACNIIRESIEVEGVLYIDASVRTFGGLVGKEVFEPPILERVSATDSSSDESQAPLPASNIDQQHCGILGFSTSSGSSINGHKPSYGHTAVPERLLQRLLQRYPHGRIFNFEPDGLVSDHSGSEIDDSSSPISPLSVGSLHPFGPDEENNASERPRRRSRNHHNIASCLLKMFPGARSLAFVPLFDGQKHRWFAGGFVWTKTPTRIFTVENELSYLRVFGLATMAEVGRLNTKAADKTKTDILGSISHELRSPLHGVVGSVELLRNTVLDGTQENILRTIETSGRTLLDTIDHLLDYSKVNNIVRSSSRAERRKTEGVTRHRRNTLSAPTLRTPALCIHLDRLAEEVVESVLAGWSYRNMSDAHFAAWHTLMQGSPKLCGDSASNSDGFPGPHRPSMQHGRNRKPVQIYLDIDHTVSWSFRTHPGAFRRIVLNLFGNSLKFTKVGFIRVSMKQERGDCKRHDGNLDGQHQTKVVLTVSDSGKGISQDYLSNQLFTPFSQEDHFAPGTGLGLSLVRQMVVSLGGAIDVLSQVGQGTTMTVTLPLSPFVLNIDEVAPSISDESDTRLGKNMKDHLTGKRIHLVGFDKTLTIREGIFGQEDSKEKSQVQLLESICHGWLKMNVVLPSTQDGKTNEGECVDQAVIAEEDFVLSFWKSHAARPSKDGPMEENQSTCPRLVVCRDSSTMYALTKPSAGVVGRGSIGVSYISQPIGPRKLAEALVASRVQWIKSQNMGINNNNTHPPIVTPKPPSASPPPAHTPLPTRPRLSLDTIAAPAQRPIPPIDGPSTPAAPTSVLIVDDNPINLKILAGYMLKIGHPHVSAVNGLEAMQTYTSSPEHFRCIVTDISMPIMDGLESTRRIREFERAQKIKPVTVIALTGLSGEEIQQNAFVSGVDLFLTRPVVLSGLKGALEATGHGGCVKEGEGVGGS